MIKDENATKARLNSVDVSRQALNMAESDSSDWRYQFPNRVLYRERGMLITIRNSDEKREELKCRKGHFGA